MAHLVPHARVDIVFDTMAGQIRYDPETFDDVDDEINALFGTA